jgi:virulence factor Mce-like protein
MAAVVGFTASVVCLLLYLWIAFGGSVPLRAEGYRVQVQFDEAALLVEQADVRIAGLNVGKVAVKSLDEGASATVAELEIEPEYAPIPRDTRATLRQKGLLGETYVELSPGTASGPKLEDGDMLPTGAAQETVEIDEIVRTFDRPTRQAFQGWVKELATAIDKGRGEDLNDALGNLPEFVATGDDVLRVLDEEHPVLSRLVRNGGRALGAVNERRGQLRELIVNADDFFGALNSRNDALADTVFVLPTFLDETRATMARLQTFSAKAAPLMRDLQPVATDLRPTLRDVGRLAPDLKGLFKGLDPVIGESPRTLPAAARFLSGAEPLFEGLHAYLPELNPILSFANYSQAQLADFFMNSTGSIGATLPPISAEEGPRHYLRQYGAINTRGLGLTHERPEWERANSYPAANYLSRSRGLGIVEAFDCKPAGGPQPEQKEGLPPCFVAPGSLYDGLQYPNIGHGQAPIKDPPGPNDGRTPARPFP